MQDSPADKKTGSCRNCLLHRAHRFQIFTLVKPPPPTQRKIETPWKSGLSKIRGRINNQQEKAEEQIPEMLRLNWLHRRSALSSRHYHAQNNYQIADNLSRSKRLFKKHPTAEEYEHKRKAHNRISHAEIDLTEGIQPK